MIAFLGIRIHERQLVHVIEHMGSLGLSNVQQYAPQHESGVYQTHDLCSNTTCWESRLSLHQNQQVLVNDRIAKDKDP